MAELSNNEAGRGYTDVIRLTYLDLQSIGNAGQQTIATIPAGGAVELAGVHEATAVAGTTTLVIDVGTTSGDPDEFIDALDVDGMSVPVFNTGDAFTGGQSQPVGGAASATSILLEVTDSNIDNATAGEIVIGLRILDLGQFAVT